MAESARALERRYSEREIEEMETSELLRLYKETGNEELKWPLVLRYEHLVKSAAIQVRGVYSSFAQIEDIINEGILTLLTAIDKFDPDKGVKFETYVAKRIRGMMIDLARKQDWIPRVVRRREKEIETAVSELSNTLGHYPSDAEITEYLQITQERYQKDLADIALSNVLSLEALMNLYESDGQQFEVPSTDTENQPESFLQEKELQQMLAKGISGLRKKEQIVLSLHYEENLQFKEIAQIMNVSAPRISQIHAKAIEKLRYFMESYVGETREKPTVKEKKV